MNEMIDKNKVTVAGEICGSFEYSHEVFGEKFYLCKLRVERLSAKSDFIPIMVSERIIDVNENLSGIFVEVKGQLRSFTRCVENKNKLELSVFVKEMQLLDYVYSNENHIELDGFVCKTPLYRTTPLGREISDLFVAVNRPYGKSDYIPCITWGRNAKFAENLEVGTHLKLEGRIQSREYQKKISDTETETRTAYEVSVSKLEVVDDKN